MRVLLLEHQLIFILGKKSFAVFTIEEIKAIRQIVNLNAEIILLVRLGKFTLSWQQLLYD